MAKNKGTLNSFRLSERAKSDLIAIYIDSVARFGNYQAEAYYAGLDRIFGLLADFPLMGQDAGDLRSGYRRFHFQSHIVFYSEGPEGVVIRSILHKSREIRSDLFE